MLMQILFWIIVVLLFLSWSCARPRASGPAPPLYPGALPVIGHSTVLLEKGGLWEILKKVSTYSMKVGGVARLYSFWWNIYLVTDPEDSQTVLSRSNDKSYIIYGFAKEWLDRGLVTARVSSWKDERKYLNRAFTQRTLNTFLKVFNIQSQRMADLLAVHAGKGRFEPYDCLVDNVLETTNETVLGLKSEENTTINNTFSHEITELMDMYIERLQKVWLHLSFFYKRSELKQKQDKIITRLKELSYQVIAKRKPEFIESRNSHNEADFKTVLDFVLQYFLENEEFTEEHVRQHLETFVIGAFDSTSSTLVFVLKYIGAYPEVQERIYQEIKEVFGDENRDVTKDDLPKLVYLDAVLKETVRLYPAIPVIARDIYTDIKLKNCTLPAGTTFVCSLFHLNRHESWGKDAEQFRPERWLEPKVPGTLLGSFGFGKRSCIGGTYALMSMKTMLVRLCRRYRFEADKTEGVLRYNIFLKPVSGYDISIELRS